MQEMSGLRVRLDILGRHRGIECETVAEAQELYRGMRDDSGEGFSTWPNGAIWVGNDRVIYLSYNGRMWLDVERGIEYDGRYGA